MEASNSPNKPLVESNAGHPGSEHGIGSVRIGLGAYLVGQALQSKLMADSKRGFSF